MAGIRTVAPNLLREIGAKDADHILQLKGWDFHILLQPEWLFTHIRTGGGMLLCAGPIEITNQAMASSLSPDQKAHFAV